MEKNRKKEILLILVESILLMWYWYLGKYDWEYGFDLPYRIGFDTIFYVIAVVIFGAVFYFIGKKNDNKNDRILLIPIISTILALITLFRTDIVYISRFCIYNAFFIIGTFNGRIELKTVISSIAKIVLWFTIMYLFIPFVFITLVNSLNLLIDILIWIIIGFREETVLEDIPEILYFIELGIVNIYFGYAIKKYFSKTEINIVRILLILGCSIMLFVFLVMGFSWYTEDYYGIIYTFHYKVIMYLIEEESNTEIIKTVYSKYFLYAVYTYAMFFIGTFCKRKTAKNEKEKQTKNDEI